MALSRSTVLTAAASPFVSITLLLHLANAHADPRTPTAESASPVGVIYFGGYGSTPPQMRCWEQGAQANAHDLQSSAGEFQPSSTFIFTGIAYPSDAGADKASAVKGGRHLIAAAVTEIDSHPDRHYIIAGHSSGAALANETARRVRDPAQIRLVDLDGFAADPALQNRVHTTCWYALNPRTGLESRNATSMRANCARSASFSDRHCRTSWCLHFVLANLTVPPDLSGRDFKRLGYEGCDSNLEWLFR